VSVGPPAVLHIVQQPSATQSGGVLFDVMPVLQIQDAGRNNFTDDSGISISAVLVSDSALGLFDPATVPVLSGTTTVTTRRGLAAFTDLSVRKAGSNFVLTFRVDRTSSSDVLETQSRPFDVQVGPATALAFHRQPITSATGVALLGRPQIMIVDQGGNAVATPSLQTISVWLVTDLAECSQRTYLVGDSQHTTSKAVAEISTTSIAYPCASVRMRATVSTGSFIADSVVFSSDVGPPLGFEVAHVTASAASLMWRSPTTGEAPSALFLTYGPRPGYRAEGEDDVTIRLSGDSTQALVSGLSAHKAYSFKLCSVSLFSARETQLGEAPAAFEETCASGSPAELVAAPIQAPEYFEVQFVGPDFLDLKWSAPVIGPPPPAYRVTITCNNVSSCSPEEYGREQRAYTRVPGPVGSAHGLYVQQDAPAAQHAGGVVTFRVSNVSSAKGYDLKVVSRAAVLDVVFNDLALYAPSGPAVANVYPMSTPSRDTFTVMCADLPCSGSQMLVAWLASEAPGAQVPQSYRVAVAAYNASTGRVIGAASVTEVAHGAGGTKSTVISGISKGVLIQVRLYALSPVAHPAYYGPAAERIFRPISRPSPPTALAIKVVRNTELQVSWEPPADSGDGTQDGVNIVSYSLEYKRPDSEQWMATSQLKALSTTLRALEQGLNYSINCYATSQQILAEGGASFASAPRSVFFYYGRAPFWDSVLAPPETNPPTIYFAYINNLFSMRIKALDPDLAHNITISATGLSACGGMLTQVSVTNPASALFVMLPKPQDAGKTFLICYTAHDSQDMSAPRRCFRLSIASPAPVFHSPRGVLGLPATSATTRKTPGSDPASDAGDTVATPATPNNAHLVVPEAEHVKALVSARAGCRVEIPIVAVDATSAAIPGQAAAARGYMLRMDFHVAITTSASGAQTVSEALPQGASLSQGDMWDNPVRRTFSWAPERGQDSQVSLYLPP
jgi:hypothetical protein